MSAGLDASTVTPGSTLPDASFTTPAISLWADDSVGQSSAHENPSATTKVTVRIDSSMGESDVNDPAGNCYFGARLRLIRRHVNHPEAIRAAFEAFLRTLA